MWELFFCIFIIAIIFSFITWLINGRKKEIVVESSDCEDCPFHYEYYDKEKHEHSFKCTLMDRSIAFDDLDDMFENCLVGGKREIKMKEIK